MKAAYRHGLVAAAMVAVIAAAPANAALYTIDLTGSLSNIVNGSNPGTFFSLDLDYAGDAFDLQDGDRIVANVTLDGSVAVPQLPGGGALFFDPLISQPLNTPPNGDVTQEASVTLLDGELANQTRFSACVNCVFSAFSINPGDGPFGFSQLTTTIDILQLFPADPSQPVTVSGFRLSGVSFAGAVPEPASWALMIGGFGLAGGVMRRKPRFVPALRTA